MMHTRLPFAEWGVPLVVTQAGMPQINVDVTSEGEFLILILPNIQTPFEIDV